jgi:hypothetical protein
MGLFAFVLTGALPLMLFVRLATVCGRAGSAGSVYAPVLPSAGATAGDSYDLVTQQN